MEFSEFSPTLRNIKFREKNLIKENFPEPKKVMLMNHPFVKGGAMQVMFIAFLSEELLCNDSLV